MNYFFSIFELLCWNSIFFFFFDKKYCIFGKFGTAERLAYLMNEKKVKKQNNAKPFLEHLLFGSLLENFTFVKKIYELRLKFKKHQRRKIILATRIIPFLNVTWLCVVSDLSLVLPAQHQELGGFLSSIPTVSVVVVNLVYDQDLEEVPQARSEYITFLNINETTVMYRDACSNWHLFYMFHCPFQLI